MLYEENTVEWKVGDLVIHDADAKKPHMLMRVIRIRPDGQYVTKYIDKRWVREPPISNDKKYLHDPKRFGIQV